MEKVKIQKTIEQLKKEAIKRGCLGWYLRMVKPGLLPK